jgi:hypothetical protein
LQATTTCCSVMSVFLFLKFFTDWLTLLWPMRVSSYSFSKSCMNIQCGDFLRKRKFCCCTLLNQHVLTTHFLTLYYNYVTGSSDMIYIPLSDNTSYIVQCSTVWPVLTISWCSWLSVWSPYFPFPLCINGIVVF